MKKIILAATTILFGSFSAFAADVDYQQMDTATRMSQPASNSIMFRRNAEQYRQLTDEQKQEIERQRELAHQKVEEYERQKAEYERRKAAYEAQKRAQEEAERKRAEALKPIKLYENSLKIYALVNGEVITSSDMQSRINAFILTTGIPYNNSTKAMITNKVLQAAIDEKLKIQEAKNNNIKISQADINKAVRNFEKNSNMKPGQLKQILTNAKVSMNVWFTQAEAELAWKKLIGNKGYGRINVSENDIDRALAEIKKDMQTEKFMVSEIVINKKDAKDIAQLSEILRQDPRFELYAMQFSQSPSAANGGRLGWITKGKLPPLLEKAILSQKEGGVTNPIAYGNDFYVLKLEKIFNPQTDAASLPSRKEVKQFLENKKLEEFSNKYIKDLRNRALIEKKI
ncbi:MAG: peptidylprolyl isomerase [Alphaproteobacteria bacterium]|nr:peptidylprolyl isomerase [Alphaproteobacteria bacterium]